MRRRTLFKKDGGASSRNLADAVFYDSNSDSFVTMSPDEITSVIDGYTPIGVVAIPASHDVYGDGTCGVISLAEMNCDTPDVGSANRQYIYWGGYGIDTSLPNLDMVNRVYGTTGEYGYLPSDHFSYGTTSSDGVTRYRSSSTDNSPSPYNADGSRNEAYYTTVYSTANAFSDFDGIGNTKVLTDLATAQSDWKNADTITNIGDVGYYPAACCCWRFHTAGTSQGQWYLPACGEMGYVNNRISAINTTINKIISFYSNVVVAVAMGIRNSRYFSSSEHSADYTRSFAINDGSAMVDYKNYGYYVRAFLRV